MAVKCGNCKERHESAVDVEECYFPEFYDERTCSLCDAVSHGYPGGGPCPLEERGWDDWRQEELESSYR